MDVQHPRLVHLAAALVGTPDSGVALLELWAVHGRARGSGKVLALRIGQNRAGSGRARYVVFKRPVAVFDARVAGRYAGSADVLSDLVAGDGLRHHLLLG